MTDTMDYLSGCGPTPSLLLFGPQALNFDIESFKKLCIPDSPHYQWVLETVAALPSDWSDFPKSIPKLRHYDGVERLKKLKEWVSKGKISEPYPPFPLQNIILSPLVVITQLIQYWDFLNAALPELADTDELPKSITTNTETLGLCTGMLSAFAVACSSNLKKLQHFGAVAVRLAMLVGALVDAEEEEEESQEQGGNPVSFSLTWNSTEAGAALKEVLDQFPEVYISLLIDEKRITITASERTASSLVQRLKLAGVYATKIALRGKFHWKKHQEDVEHLIECCTTKFQFPDASEMIFPSRSNSGGEYVTVGKLHEIALRSILVEQSQWLKTFSVAYSSRLNSNNASVICFGPERCVPPTIARQLGSKLTQIAEIDLSTSLLPGEFLGRHQKQNLSSLPDERIAVIGMGCQLPGAEDLDEYWKILSSGISQHTEVPAARFSMETTWREADPKRKWFGNFVQNYDTFDHKFFKKSPREMASTDPQHRLMLQIAYQTVEQSGYFRKFNTNLDKHIGCFLGVGNVDYEDNIACYPANAYSATGNLKSFVAGKISHYFGWTGPSLTIDTACSSSSVAIHHACRSILSGECTSALAGGVNIITSPNWYHNLSGASFLSPTGQCKPFDAKGDGYCRGEGVGAVFLKKLSSAIADGDQVLGVISSTGVYQNGNDTAITVPISNSLSELFLHVLRKARLEPKDISVVEAHGTGTPVGDPAEYKGIQKVFGSSSQNVSLTSVKGLIGHTECASGVASLLKVLLMIQKGLIPPQASFTSLNPELGFTPEDGIEIPVQLKPWDVGFRATLINNYGASGSNASMVVTQAPKFASQAPSKLPLDRPFPFWFCGSDEKSLRAYVRKLLQFLQSSSASGRDMSMSNLSFQVSYQSNRFLDWALILNCSSSSELENKLLAYLNGEKSITAIKTPLTRPAILCFGGQVSTYVGLDQEVYETASLLRRYLDQCDAMFISMGLSSIYPDIFQKSPVQDILKLHTILFAMQYSCAKTWIDCGVTVAAVIGHSFGELTALCVSNAMTLKHAIEMIAGRARLIQNNWTAERGCMMAVEADPADLNALLAKSNNGSGVEVSIACYNGPRNFTLAGTEKAIESLEEVAKSDPSLSSIKLKKLNVTNAFHCPLVDPLLGDLEKLGKNLMFKEPDILIERATEHNFTNTLDEKFLANHIRNPVFFHHAVQRLAKKFPSAIWLEAGSNSTVTTMASRALGSSGSISSHFQPVNITKDGSLEFLAETTSRLWREGLNILFWTHHPVQTSSYTPIILPPYQFEKSKHWTDLKKAPKLEVPIVENPQEKELRKGLTTFVGYQDEANRSALFEVNSKTERFTQLVSGHIMANAAAVCPGIFQMELALDALMGLRPEFANLSFQPELRSMQHYHPLVPEDSKLVWIEAKSNDPQRLVWDWKIVATRITDSSSTNHTSGTFVFQPENDSQLKVELEEFERWVGRKRCIRLLESREADDILQGRNIYRAFSSVIDYKELYRHVSIIVGKDNESVGRVTKIHTTKSWLDSILTDCFCQVAGIFVNLMTDRSDTTEGGIFVCDGIGRWFRSPKMRPDAAQPDFWEVFALHHPESEKKYISDIFVFDPRDGSLVEVVLRISYQWVLADGIRKALSTSGPSGHQLPKIAPVHIQARITAPTSTPAPVNGSKPKEKKKKGAAKKASVKTGPDVAGKTREIICNLSGLEPDEVKDNSDLIEIGIDSLMSMELTREVDSAFKCSLDTSQLMDLTDFQSLVKCIQTILGLENQDATNFTKPADTSEEESEEEPAINGATRGVNGAANGVTNGATNGAVNGASNGVGNGVPKDHTLPVSVILDTFHKAKKATDDFIFNGQLGTYYNEIMPRSTELCIVYILNAFEELGCSIRTAAPGQRLERVPYLPKHEQLMNLIYELLWKEARLIDINGAVITRTAVAPPTKPAEVLLEELLRDEPFHAAEHKLTSLTGSRFADCITGKADGLQMIFGTPEGREIVSDVYAKSPINLIWIQQAEYFIENLMTRLPKDGEPLRILEMGAGTGGTTVRMVQLLDRLGVPVKYTMTDLSSSLIAAARKRFKKYPFMEFKTLDIEASPDPQLLHSQHIILATNCVHATRNLTISTSNIHKILRPDGFLLLLEMTEQVPWVDFIFGLLEGWWLFEDGRQHALAPATHWEKVLSSVGFGHVDWTVGNRPEANIQRLIIALASGSRYDRGPIPLFPTAQMMLTDNTARKTIIDAYIHEYTKDFVYKPRDSSSLRVQSSAEYCVLVTGATGSLGSHIVAYLAQLPEVKTVVCLNRLSTVDATLRQQQSFRIRGISLGAGSISKLKVIETDTTKTMLGLQKDTFQYLVDHVTHIVHNAWPMSLTRTIRAYESQFKVMRNLIILSRDAMASSYRHGHFKMGFQFISSIGVVGYYPLWAGKALAPEKTMPVDPVLPVGYADAKLVCEQMLDETLHRYPEQFRPMAVRIAQITGSKTNGYWNSVEHFASFLRSSQTLKILPDLKGTLSWCPVEDVAATLGELLIPNTPQLPTHDSGNPSRQPWPDMIITLANELGISTDHVVPFDEWLSRVRSFPGSTNDNPAGQLVEFFEKHFVRMSCGGLILDTARSREHSKTLRNLEPVSIELVRKYFSSWKTSGFLS